VAVATGTHRLGPGSASLQIRTYREGVAARAGHDLVIDVTRWEATVELAGEPAGSKVELTADPRSLEVAEGRGGLKPLTDRDRAEILRSTDEKVLRGRPIRFRSTAVRPEGDGFLVEGDLTIAGSTRPITARLDAGEDGRVTATIVVAQSDWGIKPYRGMMGALKVRDDVEVSIAARLPAR
jgi:polyisoprenoid-binding protein YceI